MRHKKIWYSELFLQLRKWSKLSNGLDGFKAAPIACTSHADNGMHYDDWFPAPLLKLFSDTLILYTQSKKKRTVKDTNPTIDILDFASKTRWGSVIRVVWTAYFWTLLYVITTTWPCVRVRNPWAAGKIKIGVLLEKSVRGVAGGLFIVFVRQCSSKCSRENGLLHQLWCVR